MAVDVEVCYRRYGPMVLRRCRVLLGEEQAARDAMQDVFVEVLRRKDTLDDRGLSSLLFRVATNVCLNRLRTRRRRPETADQELVDKIIHVADLDRASEVRSTLARLFGDEPTSTAAIAVWHFVDGMTLEEVATHAGMSVSGVRKRLRKLDGKLQQVDEKV